MPCAGRDRAAQVGAFPERNIDVPRVTWCDPRMTADSEHEPADESSEVSQVAVSGVLELAPNGRARCRACGETLVKNAWRLGERAHNPFGEGETTYWFHASCGARRRSAVFLAALQQAEADAERAEIAALLSSARFGSEHQRADRIADVSEAPSGRARCRHCRDLIEKGALRIVLSIFKDGRFDPMGYLHCKCLTEYVGAAVPFERLEHLSKSLTDEQRQAVLELCSVVPQQ